MKDLEITIHLPSLQLTIPEEDLNFQHLEKFVRVNILWVLFFAEKILPVSGRPTP